jgi:hypothetical protein
MKRLSKSIFLSAMVFLLFFSHANVFAQNLDVTDAQSLSGTFDNLTIKDGGIVTLTSELVVNVALVIETGGVLDMGLQTVSGAAAFTMQTNSTLIFGTSNAASLLLTGTKTWGGGVNFVLNGTELQTLTGFPTVVRSLTLDNPAGMYLNANLEIGASVTVNQGRFNLNNNQLRVRNFEKQHIVFINNSSADHNFRLRFQKADQIFEVQGTEMLNLNDVDSQSDRCKVLMNNHVNLKADQRLEKGSHFELNGYNLVLRPAYDGFGGYGDRNYFLSNNGGSIIQNLNSTAKNYTYNMVSPNMAASVGILGSKIEVKVGFSASAIGANASYKMTLVEGIHPAALGAVTTDYLKRYFQFEFVNVTNPNVSLEFTYLDEDVVGEESAYEAFFYNGTEWLSMDGLLVNSGNIVSVTGINGNGAVTLGRFLGMDVIPCPNPDNLTTSNIAFTSALLDWEVWAPDAIGNFVLQYREVGASEWISVESVLESQYQLSGIASNVAYEWRVSSACNHADFTDASLFSDIATFTTQEDNGCMAPVGLQVGTLSPGSAVVSWLPVPSVTTYSVEYKLEQATDWTELSVDGAQSQVTLPLLDENQYQVRIKTLCGATESLVYSQTLSFLSFIEGFDAATNSIYISSERDVPTVIQFGNVYVQYGGKATLTANLTVGKELIVEAGGVLYCQNFTVNGNRFVLEDDGHLGIGSAAGISLTAATGNIQTVVRSYSSKATYEYNGTVDQVKGDGLVNYTKLIVNSGRKLDMGQRPSLGSYILITSGYMVSNLNSYLNKNTVIENNAGPDAIALLTNTQTTVDNVVITLKGTSPTRVNFHVDKQATFHVYTDIIVDRFTSYNGIRGTVYMHGANLIFYSNTLNSPNPTFSVNQLYFDGNSRFVQWVDEAFVGTEKVYNRFFDSEGNKTEFRFTLNSLDAIDANAAFTFKSVPRSHPERGGALNFLKTYLDVSTQSINTFTANLSLNYLPSQVVGEENLMQAGFFSAGAWSYDGTLLNQGDKQVIANGISTTGQLTAGFDFSLEAQACAAPDGLSATDIDYQGAVLSWEPVVNGVDAYRVSYRKTGDSEWMFQESAGGANLVLTNLHYDTEYEWQVHTLCVPGYYAESGASETSIFRTEPLKACDTPEGLLTDDVTASTAILMWNPVGGATGYTLQYRPEGASAWEVVNAGASVLFEAVALTSSANYEWRVRSACGPGYYENSDFTETPIAFATTAPCDTATGLSTSDVFYYGATLNWTPNSLADNQTARYARVGSYDWSSITGLAATDNLLATGEVLSAEKAYQWQVRSYCTNGGISPFTASALFTTTKEPVCKEAVDFNVSENTTSAVMSWSSGGSTASEQSWIVGFRKGGDEQFVNEQVVGNELIKTGLLEGTIYEWRVQTHCDGAGYPWEASEWSAIQEFSTWMTCNTVPTGLTAQVEGWCSANLGWDEITGVTNYELRYRLKGDAEWISKQLGNRNNSFFVNGTPSSTYEWQVRTYCYGTETNSNWSEVVEFTTMPDDGLSCGAPTDNPYFTKYGYAPEWTDDLPWDSYVNLADYEDGTGYWDAALLNAMMDVYVNKGGGVVYCPAGEYHFRENVDVAPDVIIRGEAPAVTDAKSADFAPPTRFVFPKYEPTFEGAGTDNTTAFKMITSGGTRSNTGMIYLDINRASVKFNVDMVAKDGYSTTQPVGEKKNVILFGIRSNNVAAPDPNVPNADQHTWQRWGYRFAVNLSAYVTENGIITNNRVNDLMENNVHPISDDSFQMPGYMVKDGSNHIALEGHQAIFDYTKHYGIELNRGKAYRTYGTREAEPSLYGLGNEVNDNWLFTTGRVGIMASGDGLMIRGNIKKDRSGKVAWVSPTGVNLVHNSATLENRGIDMSGENVTVKDNYIEVYNDNLKNAGYLSVDGEGILIQECCGGSTVNNFVIEHNTVKGSNGYIGIYKMRDINGLIIRNNDLSLAQGMQSGHSIWVDADTNGSPYRADNVRIEGNKVNKLVALRAATGACNTYIVNNYGTGSVQAPCNTVVANNTGLTYDGIPCAPEAGCDMPGAPEITTFDPQEGAELYEVTLQGLNFDGTEKIFVGSVEVSDYSVLDNNTVRFSIPTGAVTGKITIQTNKGQWNGSSYDYPSVGVSDQDFVIGEGVAKLVLTPVPGNYDGPVTVTISSATEGAVIYYTLDGSEPVESSTAYASGVQIIESSELRARGYKPGLYPSIVTSGMYMLQIIDADFSYSSTSIGEPIVFTAGVLLPFGEVAKVEWDFNNNGEFERAGMIVDYQFANEGLVSVRMKVTTDLGFTKEVVKNITLVSNGRALLRSDLKVELWPNPASDFVNVLIHDANIGSQIKYFVTDLSGRLLQFNELAVTAGESFTINMSGLNPGSYLVGLYVNDRLEIKKVMVK